MTRYCKNYYYNYYNEIVFNNKIIENNSLRLRKNDNNCGFFKSRKPRKLCLNLSSKFVVLKSIMKKFPNVLVHTLQAAFIIDGSTSLMLWFRIILFKEILSLILNNMK